MLSWFSLTWLDFWFLRLFVCAEQKYCSENNITKNGFLLLETNSFTKLSQNVWLINTNILINIDMLDVTAIYRRPFDSIAFFLGIFTHNSTILFIHQTFTNYLKVILNFWKIYFYSKSKPLKSSMIMSFSIYFTFKRFLIITSELYEKD